jgi:hypothetical protein
VSTQVQSVPWAGQTSQTFETIEAIEARPAWNAMTPILTEVPMPDKGDASIYLQGTSTGLNPGDGLLIVGGERESNVNSNAWDFRRAVSVTPDTTSNRTLVVFNRPLGAKQSGPAQIAVRVFALRQRAGLWGNNAMGVAAGARRGADQCDTTRTVLEEHLGRHAPRGGNDERESRCGLREGRAEPAQLLHLELGRLHASLSDGLRDALLRHERRRTVRLAVPALGQVHRPRPLGPRRDSALHAPLGRALRAERRARDRQQPVPDAVHGHPPEQQPEPPAIASDNGATYAKAKATSAQSLLTAQAIAQGTAQSAALGAKLQAASTAAAATLTAADATLTAATTALNALPASLANLTASKS